MSPACFLRKHAWLPPTAAIAATGFASTAVIAATALSPASRNAGFWANGHSQLLTSTGSPEMPLRGVSALT